MDGRLLPQLIAAQAERTPEAVAVVAAGAAWTYRELDARAATVAHRLRTLGVGPDTIVGLCVARAPEMLAALLGVLRAGGAYLPLDPEYPPARLALMLEDSGAPMIAVDAALAGRLPATSARVAVLEPDGGARSVLSRAVAHPSLRAQHLAYVLFTSGSTGRPKGVGVTHGALVNVLASVRDLIGFAPGDRIVSLTSLSFDIATVEMFVPLLAGGSVFIAGEHERRDGAALAAAIAQSGANVVQATPSSFRMLLASGWRPGPLKLISGGEALTADLARELASNGARLWNGYGPSETSVYSTFHALAGEEEPVPIGRGVAGTELRVLDGNLHPAAPGAPGELFIAGAGVARGYVGKAALTAERFLPDPAGPAGSRAYRTGDAVRLRPDGELEFLGRLDHQVKVRGNRVELGEVEAALTRHEAVAAAAVSNRPDGRGGARLAAYLVLRRPLRPAAMRAWLRDRVPDFMVPSAFAILDALPLTPSGKIDRLALPEPAGLRPDLETAYLAPRNPVEESLVQLWEEVLDVQPVGVEDDFLDLGGDSLQATLLMARVREAFGIELGFASWLGHLTVSGLAVRVGAGTLSSAPMPPSGDPARPSSAEQGVWFQEQLIPGTPVFNIPLGYRIRGALDGVALELAWQEVVERHPALRMRLETVAGRPVRVVSRSSPFCLAVSDLSRLAAADAEARLQELMRVEASTPFDIAQGPLIRARLITIGPGDRVLLVTLHHLVADAWSVSVLVDEVRRLYAAYSHDLVDPPDLAPPAATIGAGWRDELLRQGALGDQVAYWKQQLRDAERLVLPTDFPRAATQTFTGARHSTAISAGLTQGLKELSRRLGVTPFMTLLAAFNVLVHRLSGQDDVVIGTPVAGRNRAGLEHAVGLLVNLLVLRSDLSGDPSFADLLGRVKDFALGAYANQDLPFERLVEELHPVRDPSRNPLFQVLFNMYNFPSCDLRLDALEVQTLQPPMAGSLFDLTLYALEEAGSLHFDFVYNASLFAADRVAAMAEQFVHLLEQVRATPDAAIESLSLATAGSRASLPDPTAPLPAPGGEPAIIDRLREQARRRPQAVALESAGATWTYGELARRSDELAERLLEAGAEGAVTAVLATRGPGLVNALFACLQAGSAFLVLDPAYPPARLADAVARAGAQAWIGEPGTRPQGELAAALEGLRRVDLGAGPPARSGPALRPPARDLDRPAYIAFTSGSTGRPKGVIGAQRPVCHFLGWHAAQFELGPDDRFSLLSGLAYDPLLRDVFTPIWVGGTLCIPPAEALFDPARLAGWLAASRVSVVHTTPSMLRLLAAAGTTLGQLRRVFVGGDALARADADRLAAIAPSARLVNFYGTTETPQAMSWLEVGGASDRGGGDPVPIGSGIEGAQLLLCAAHGGQAGVGELAEISVRSPYLAAGYLGEPAATADRFQGNPFAAGGPGDRLYRTGDLGRYLPDGRVQPAGRRDDQVKIRGFRVELGEVEACLRRLQGVVEAAVTANPEPTGERRLAAFVACTGPAPTLAGVRRGLQRWLPEYMLPSALVVMPSLPRTPNGKIDRRRLPRPERPRPELTPGYVMPSTDIECAIAEVWAGVLGLDRVGVEDNFFELGGSSLAVAEVHAGLQRKLEAEVSMVDLFRYPDIRTLARHLERDGAGTPTTDPAQLRILARRAAMSRRAPVRRAGVRF